MHENESIDDMNTKFAKITNGLTSLGDAIDNDQKVQKVIHALSPSWKVKITTLKELNDKEEVELIGLIGNLKTHEMKKKAREEMTPQTKKTIAFKSTPQIFDDDEDLFLLVKNVRRMHNMTKINNKRRWQEKEEKKIICFNCRKPGHIIAECLDIKNKPSSSNEPKKPFKKKALKATWDSESESEEEVDTTNVCFMANDLSLIHI